MSERKVLNKYYPPDFDPSKIPKLKLQRNRQYSIRVMAPFNMRCNTCGEYIYKGKKFNSRKETVEDEDYLGLRIFRFYIKCPRCVAEIAFKTDPERADYSLEAGATRNFEPTRTAEELAKREQKEKELEELNNPMKVLENRTQASRNEMETIETLEELKELNSRHAKVDHQNMLVLHKAYEEQLAKLQDEEDQAFVDSLFGKTPEAGSVKRLHDSDSEEEDLLPKFKKPDKSAAKPTDILTKETTQEKKVETWQKSVSALSTSKSSLAGLVRKKPAGKAPVGSALVKNKNTSNVNDSKTDSMQAQGKSEVSPSVSSSTPGSQSPRNGTAPVQKPAAISGLSMLGDYSDSDSSNDSS